MTTGRIIKLMNFHLIENWLFTTQCLLCQDTVKTGKNLCVKCIEELPWNHVACKQCANPFDPVYIDEGKEIVCGNCLSTPLPFYESHAAFIYHPPIAPLITQLKFSQNLLCGSVLSELLLTFLQKKYQTKPWPQAIIPVPLHPKRLMERGYNQATELAKPLAKALKIPLYLDICQRVKQTTTQTAISEKERYMNLKHAFAVIKPLKLKHIAIVDDVLTTGSTSTTLAKALKKSGVAQIDVWVVAKTLLQRRIFQNY